MMRSVAWLARGAVFGALLASSTAVLCQESGKEQAAFAAALRAKHVALATAIAAAASRGKPISAKYEYEDGKLQLSVYTEKAGQFSEVIVDHRTGKVAKTEKITEGDDLKAAQAQSAAVAKAKSSLARALLKALSANKGYSAVSATATLESGQAVAENHIDQGSRIQDCHRAADVVEDAIARRAVRLLDALS